jgi:hypothetical protein
MNSPKSTLKECFEELNSTLRLGKSLSNHFDSNRIKLLQVIFDRFVIFIPLAREFDHVRVVLLHRQNVITLMA